MNGSVNVPGVTTVELNAVKKVAEAAKKEAGEAAGISGVPACTESDNDKFLRVVGGKAAWAKVESAEEVSV